MLIVVTTARRDTEGSLVMAPVIFVVGERVQHRDADGDEARREHRTEGESPHHRRARASHQQHLPKLARSGRFSKSTRRIKACPYRLPVVIRS
jgi:hypothetical protein